MPFTPDQQQFLDTYIALLMSNATEVNKLGDAYTFFNNGDVINFLSLLDPTNFNPDRNAYLDNLAKGFLDTLKLDNVLYKSKDGAQIKQYLIEKCTTALSDLLNDEELSFNNLISIQDPDILNELNNFFVMAIMVSGDLLNEFLLITEDYYPRSILEGAVDNGILKWFDDHTNVDFEYVVLWRDSMIEVSVYNNWIDNNQSVLDNASITRQDALDWVLANKEHYSDVDIVI